ncbi:hypothetical protein QOZ80_9BG0702430 [Eleusine coracana subsp. coracana]|nr:hypothetical protein QOZ80_9BG0702430 [Eleusine coracana subsp. coracana]
MIRRETTINFTRAARQSHERLSLLAARLDTAAGGTSTETPLRADSTGGAYDMEVSIGTPPQKLSALADTGSDLIWVKCGRCASCKPKGSPSFNPTKSSSFSKLPCNAHLCMVLWSQNLATCGGLGTECDYRYSYGLAADGQHYTQGFLGNETFTLGSDAVKDVGFGCTTMSEGDYGTGSGLVGFGRGPLSLVSQLKVGAFSYCLIDDPSKESPLLFGSLANLTGAGVQSTKLLRSSTFYNVNLKSITIGSVTTPGTGTDGFVFDSGTTLTYLTEPAYTAAKRAILYQTSLRRVANRYGFEACFQATDNDASNVVPPMVLHFDGANMELPAENYFAEVENGVICWVVQKSPSLSIIGNIMHMNYHIRYDLDMKMLSFQQANCSSI